MSSGTLLPFKRNRETLLRLVETGGAFQPLWHNMLQYQVLIEEITFIRKSN